MSAELIADFDGALEVDACSSFPILKRGPCKSFRRGFDEKFAVGSLDDSQAAAVASNGCADGDAPCVIGSRNGESRVATLFNARNFANIRDYACEHDQRRS